MEMVDEPGIPFFSCLVGNSCSPSSGAGRTLIPLLQSPSMAILLCNAALHFKCEGCVQTGLLAALFNFTMHGSVFLKALCQPPEKEMPLLLGRVKRPTLYTWSHANQGTIEIPAE